VRRVSLAGRRGGWAWRPIRLVAAYLRDAARDVLDGTGDVPPLPEG
jgi:hypothetical protein